MREQVQRGKEKTLYQGLFQPLQAFPPYRKCSVFCLCPSFKELPTPPVRPWWLAVIVAVFYCHHEEDTEPACLNILSAWNGFHEVWSKYL